MKSSVILICLRAKAREREKVWEGRLMGGWLVYYALVVIGYFLAGLYEYERIISKQGGRQARR